MRGDFRKIDNVESRLTRIDIKTVILFGAAALWCIPCLAKAQSADDRLRAIYTEEWKWRLEQFPGSKASRSRYLIACRG